MLIRQLPFFVLAVLILVSGCAPLLPSTSQTLMSPWKTFAETKAAYDTIMLNRTTKEDLKALGFDPFSTPNITILTYADIIQKFMFNPAIRIEDLDEGLQRCIRARNACLAYEVKPEMIQTKRLGNVWLDLFNFRRNVHQTGWKFDALLVMVDDIVVYKLWGGNPLIDEYRGSKNPLGPLQSSEGILMEIVK